MADVEFDYEISEDRLRAYRDLPDQAKLRWLEDLVRFTRLFRAAGSPPTGEQGDDGEPRATRGTCPN